MYNLLEEVLVLHFSENRQRKKNINWILDVAFDGVCKVRLARLQLFTIGTDTDKTKKKVLLAPELIEER